MALPAFSRPDAPVIAASAGTDRRRAQHVQLNPSRPFGDHETRAQGAAGPTRDDEVEIDRASRSPPAAGDPVAPRQRRHLRGGLEEPLDRASGRALPEANGTVGGPLSSRSRGERAARGAVGGYGRGDPRKRHQHHDGDQKASHTTAIGRSPRSPELSLTPASLRNASNVERRALPS